MRLLPQFRPSIMAAIFFALPLCSAQNQVQNQPRSQAQNQQQDQTTTDGVNSHFLIIPHRSRLVFVSKKDFKKVEQAANKGFRILPIRGGVAELVMEKDENPAATYSYKLFKAGRGWKTAQKLNEAAEGGFRIIPSTFVYEPQEGFPAFPLPFPVMSGNEIYAVWERAPNPAACDYIEKVSWGSEESLFRWADKKAMDGFSIVVIADVHEGPWALMEKCTGAGHEKDGQISVPAPAIQYRWVRANQARIDNFSAEGYSMLQAYGNQRYLFQKTEGQDALHTYKLVNLKSLEKMVELGRDGYRFVPRSVSQKYLAMEHSPNSKEVFDYRVEECKSVPQLYGILEHARLDGYKLVSIIGPDVILEKPASNTGNQAVSTAN